MMMALKEWQGGETLWVQVEVMDPPSETMGGHGQMLQDGTPVLLLWERSLTPVSQQLPSGTDNRLPQRQNLQVTRSDDSPFTASSAKSRSSDQLQFYLLQDRGRTYRFPEFEGYQWEIRDPREKQLRIQRIYSINGRKSITRQIPPKANPAPATYVAGHTEASVAFTTFQSADCTTQRKGSEIGWLGSKEEQQGIRAKDGKVRV